MLEFKDLPYVVNKQILRSFLHKSWSVNQMLALIGVCHDWRRIGLPIIYDTLRVRECSDYDHRLDRQMRLPSPSGRLWNINVAPFNAHDVVRFAKRMRIAIFTLDGFEDLKTLLEYIISLDPCGWKRISKLDFWLEVDAFNGDNNYNFTQYLQSLSAYLLDVFSGITELSVFTSSTESCVEPFIVQLTAGYSDNLQLLSTYFPMTFSNYISFQNLTALHLRLNRQNCQLLSFANPLILRKLYLAKASGIYLWKHFTSPTTSSNQLNFAMLTELDIEAKSSFGILNEVSAFSARYKRLSNDWEHDILDRRVVFPSLDVLRVNGGHFGDLLFKNCVFPYKIRKLKLRDSVGLIENSSLLLSRVMANCVYICISSKSDEFQYIPGYGKIFGPGHGSKINSLKIYLKTRIDPSLVDMPMLRNLQVDGIHFNTLAALIKRLFSLRQLSVKLLECDDDLETECLDLDKLTSEPLSSSIIGLNIERITSTFAEPISLYIECLVIALPQLRFAILMDEFAEIIKAFVLDNRDKYPHFKSLFSRIFVA